MDKRDFAQEFYWQMREAVTGRLTREAKRIAEKAKQNNVPLDTMIMRDARYMAEMEYSGGN